MKNTKKRLYSFFFLIALGVFLSACGVSENASPRVLPKGESTLTYSVSILQTDSKSQIGDEFILAPSIKSSWGLENYFELSLKTFGLGLGADLKKAVYEDEDYALSVSGAFGFSFPMSSYLLNKVAPFEDDFRNFVSSSFYLATAKLHGGVFWDRTVFSLFVKGGYLDHSGLFPDMGSDKDSSFPGFVLQSGFTLFFRENRKSNLALGIEMGYIVPLKLLYLSGSYTF